MRPNTGKIEDEYAWLAEVQMATLSWLCLVKKSSHADITRQFNICLHAIRICEEHASEITWESGPYRHHGRVKEILDARNKGCWHETALAWWVYNHIEGDKRRERWLKSYMKDREEKMRR